jgi:DNA-binding transcriptional ArsR family regulator
MEAVHAFDILGDPVRRRILEVLAGGEQPAGTVAAVIQREFGISQPAVSHALRVLRDNGFATVRSKGARRLYAVDPGPLQSVDDWLAPYKRFWNGRLDALDTELAHGKPSGTKTSEHNQPKGGARS